MLIAIEGIDGVGKTSLAKEVVFRLRQQREEARYVSFPTDNVRDLLQQETSEYKRLLLFVNDHLSTLQSLDPNILWVMDRSFISTYVYQFTDPSLESVLYRMKEKFSQFPIDMCFWVTATFDICNHRIQKRIDAGLTDRLLTQEEFQRLHLGYSTQCQFWSRTTWVVDNYQPHHTFNSSVQRILDGISYIRQILFL